MDPEAEHWRERGKQICGCQHRGDTEGSAGQALPQGTEAKTWTQFTRTEASHLFAMAFTPLPEPSSTATPGARKLWREVLKTLDLIEFKLEMCEKNVRSD